MTQKSDAASRQDAYWAVFEHGLDGALFTIPDGRVLAANPAASRILGASAEEICTLGRLGIIDATDERWGVLIRDREVTGRVSGVARMMRSDGTTFEAELVSSIFEIDGDKRASIIFRDVTDRVAMVAELARAERQWRLAFDSAPTGIALMTPEGRWLNVNAAFARIVGYDESQLVGMRFHDITHPDDRPTDDVAQEQLIAGEIERFTRDKRYIHKDGHIVWVRLSVGLVRDDKNYPAYFVSHYEDITAERERTEQLADLALRDPLTKLANRARFVSAVSEVRADEMFAVAFVDLDNFKDVNDKLGHAAGDELLLAVAGRLLHEMRPRDLVARLGGDEFAILLRRAPGNEVEAITQRLLHALAAPYHMSEGVVSVTCSIGVAAAGSERHAEGLLMAADVAMYAAKRSGKNAVRLAV